MSDRSSSEQVNGAGEHQSSANVAVGGVVTSAEDPASNVEAAAAEVEPTVESVDAKPSSVDAPASHENPAIGETLASQDMASASNESTNNAAAAESVPVVGIVLQDTTQFNEDELRKMPICVAYIKGDKESERSAMAMQQTFYEQRKEQQQTNDIATERPADSNADQAAPRRRTKQVARKSTSRGVARKPENGSTAGTDESSSKKRQKSDTMEPNVTAKMVKNEKSANEIESIPAPEGELAGLGWTRKTFSRRTDPSHHDRYWYTPKTQRRLRSMNEVRKFLEFLTTTDGDEDAAYEKFKRR